MKNLFDEKHSGIFIPLFSMRSTSDWGIGDFKSLKLWIKWACENNTKIVQILSINEMPPNSTSPYSAISAFAIDPVYISIEDIEDVTSNAQLNEFINTVKTKNSIAALNRSDTVDYKNVRQLKQKIFEPAFDYFFKTHWIKNTQRAGKFKHFMDTNAHWLETYAVFRTAKDIHKWHSWTHWPVHLKICDRDAIKQFNARHSYKVLFYKYLQWLCYEQINRAKIFAHHKHILLFGDIAFIINQESADVWSNQDIFDISLEIGSPPDEFNKSGQKWGLPAYNWWNMERGNFKWWRQRIQNICIFFDIFRLDHVVGFFRTWVSRGGKTKSDFDLPHEHEQKARGERFLKMVTEESKLSVPVAEDLGIIPDFVRDVLKNSGIAGYKVLRWECSGENFKKPAVYPLVSLATTSTHDTSTLKKWWNLIDNKKRDKLWHTLTGKTGAAPKFDVQVHRTIIKKLIEGGSSLVILPIQDMLGIDGRINTPGTVTDNNWTWRFPVPIEEIGKNDRFKETLQFYNEILISSGRNLK